MPTEPSREHHHDLPDEFFLPPSTDRELWRETRILLLCCVGYLVVLAVVVCLTQHIVISV